MEDKINIIKENFNSINEMIQVIEHRENNFVMREQDSSSSGSYSFTKTNSMNEAKELFRNGYKEILPRIKSGVEANLKRTETRNRRRITSGVVGYAPNVPNAILGLPNSMILTESSTQKTKIVSIVVGITENCCVDAEKFIQSGIAALGVVNALELSGYRVNLKIAFYVAKRNNERAFGTVKVKDYREHLDLQKLCFPLAHPSMFRRLGFKWLETVPGLTDPGWAFGYGQQFSDLEFIKKNFLEPNEYFINLKITENNDYDPEKIIESLNIGK